MAAVATGFKVRRILGDFNARIPLIERYRNTRISDVVGFFVLIKGCVNFIRGFVHVIVYVPANFWSVYTSLSVSLTGWLVLLLAGDDANELITECEKG